MHTKSEVNAAGSERNTDPDLVLTPGGYRHRSLVHRLESGYALHAGDGGLRHQHMSSGELRHFPPLDPLHPNPQFNYDASWITYAQWQNQSDPISKFTTRWIVPPVPTTYSGQTIFLFSAMGNISVSGGMLLPVLQYGQSIAGGGEFWSVATWYLNRVDGQAHYTNLVQVQPHDILTSGITGNVGSNAADYTAGFQGIPDSQAPVSGVPELNLFFVTLEAFNINSCSDYPPNRSAVVGVNMEIAPADYPTINWKALTNVADCGQHTTVLSNSATEGRVDLFWRPGENHYPPVTP